jgi:hypothetical protein
MKMYKIKRWDAILPKNSSNSLPMIYINADSELLQFAQKNNYKFMVKISGTNSIYDNQQMIGVFDALLLGPNCKSKFIKDKNWYTISLDSYFYTYPPQLGEVTILGLESTSNNNIFKESLQKKLPKMLSNLRENINNPTASNESVYSTEPLKPGLQGMSVPMIIGTLGLITLLIVIIFLVFRHKK